MSPIQCYKCKKLQSYPFLKLPLGGPQVEPLANEASFAVRKGLVLYAWFCLPCGQEHAGKLTEEFLSSPQN